METTTLITETMPGAAGAAWRYLRDGEWVHHDAPRGLPGRLRDLCTLGRRAASTDSHKQRGGMTRDDWTSGGRDAHSGPALYIEIWEVPAPLLAVLGAPEDEWQAAFAQAFPDQLQLSWLVVDDHGRATRDGWAPMHLGLISSGSYFREARLFASREAAQKFASTVQGRSTPVRAVALAHYRLAA